MGLNVLQCDGCGQPGSPEHLARRLKRLEQATRFRPIHIHTLFLGTAPPALETEFLYGEGENQLIGEAASLLSAAGIEQGGKTRETVNAEFQRAGFFLTHVLECSFEEHLGTQARNELLRKRMPAALVRLKRSLRPKRVMLITEELKTHAKMMQEAVPDLKIEVLANRAGGALA